MVREFNTEDEGKRVVTNDGDVVGTIEQIEQDKAHVRPDTDLSSSIRQRLGWAKDEEEMFTLDQSHVRSFAGEEVHLKD